MSQDARELFWEPDIYFSGTMYPERIVDLPDRVKKVLKTRMTNLEFGAVAEDIKLVVGHMQWERPV